MNAGALDFWERAARTLKTANMILGADPDKSASCSYYAAFYAVSALFALEGRVFGKHSAIASAVHRDLVNTGRFAVEIGEAYSLLRESRSVGDYGGSQHVNETSAEEALKSAQLIITAVHRENPAVFPLD